MLRIWHPEVPDVFMAVKLVVADASPSVQKAVQLACPSPEFDLRPVADGRDLQELLSRERPDALLLSLSLPGGGGYDIGRSLSGRGEFGPMALFLIRGVFEPWSADRLDGIRYDGLFVKPFDSENLVRTVKEAVDRKKGPSSFPEEANVDEIIVEKPRPAAGTGPILPEALRTAVRDEILAVERELEKRIRTRILAVVKEWIDKPPGDGRRS
jgi:DNA-binding response OmpR family regulator